MDHSARLSMKSKASFEKFCELQDALIIDFSNAHAALVSAMATFVRGSAVKLSSLFFVVDCEVCRCYRISLDGERRFINVIER